MPRFCLIPEAVTKFKNGLKDGSISPEKLSRMTSEERNKFLEGVVGKDATNVNSLFESKLLLKNQKAGYIAWAKKVSGLSPEAKKDIFSKIEKLDKVLNPKEEQAFLHDLASTKLGTNVSEGEAKQIFDLSEKVREAKTKMSETNTFKTEEERLAYGRAKVELTNYVNELKLVNNRLSIKESLTPKNYIKVVSTLGGEAKSIKASMDNSAIFRQGWKSMFTNPLLWQKNARKTFSDIYRTFGGKKVADELNADLISRPNYERYAKAKLAIGTIEEAFPGSSVESIPLLGRAYKASENAYTGFLHRQRADIFDKYLDIAQKSGLNIDDAEVIKPIASMVNSLTGRGNMGRFEGSAIDSLNNVFFSPRNFKSQFDTLGHVVTGAGGSNFVRKQAAINLLKVITGTAAVLGTAHVIKPGSVEWDPRSSDFGKIKVGNTRFDVSGGMASMIVLASRLISGQSKSSTSGEITELNSGKYMEPTKKDVLYNYFENKLSPFAVVIKDILEGQDFDGNVPTVGSTLKNLFVPIGVGTFEDLQKDTSPDSPNTVIAMILDGLGIGSNTYLPKPKKENTWLDKPTIQQQSFLDKVGTERFKEANQVFNYKYEVWKKSVEDTDTYKKLDKQKQQGVEQSARQRIQDAVFQDYGFKYQEKKRTPEDNQLEKEIEKIKPKPISQAIMDKLIPPAYASEEEGGMTEKILGSSKTSTNFETGEKVTTYKQGIIQTILSKIGELFDNPKPKTTEVKTKSGAENVKMTTTVSDTFKNEQRGGSGAEELKVESKPNTGTGNTWKSKYENVWDKATSSKGVDKTVRDLIARSENGKEIENYANLNHGNMAGTFDIGLTQVNINPEPEVKSRIIRETKGMSQAEANVYLNKLIDQGVIKGEAEKLRNPDYAINKAVDLYKARLENLGDPVLAIASYNLGSGGAVLNPQEALERAKFVYNNAGIPLPETEFTKDPLKFVRANMPKYKRLGLFK